MAFQNYDYIYDDYCQIHIQYDEESNLSGRGVLHGHNCNQVELICEGECNIIINGKEYEFKKGDISFMLPTDIHQFVFKPETSCLSVFSLSFFDGMLSPSIIDLLKKTEFPPMLSLSEESFSEILHAYEVIYKEHGAGKPYAYKIIRNFINIIVIEFIRNTDNTKKIPRTAEYINAALSYIQFNFMHDITLSDIAAIAHVSTDYMSRMIERKTGKTYKEYLTELRLNYAMSLLMTTDLQISEICYSSGFNTPSYFIKIFRKRFGKTPADMRRNW